MRNRLALTLLCTLAFTAANLVARGPLSQADILDMVRNGAGSDSIVESIEQNGVGFRPEKGFLKELREAGATKAVIKAVKKAPNFGGSKATKEVKPCGQLGGEPVYEVGNGVTAPRPIHTQVPPYPPEARKAKIQGTVVLLIIVDPAGTVTGIEQVSKPIGGGLDEKTIEAVRKWKFAPATLDGKPVPVKVKIEIALKLYR